MCITSSVLQTQSPRLRWVVFVQELPLHTVPMATYMGNSFDLYLEEMDLMNSDEQAGVLGIASQGVP